MKYIIDVPEGTKWIEAYYAVDHFQYQGKSILVDSLIPYTEFNRETIENEVWELADYVVRMGVQERNLCFGFQFTTEVTANLTYQEAKTKFEKWMKNENETFDTGDEVYNKEIDSKGVILRRYNSDTLDILWDDGSAGETFAIKAITKTGRHFPEVAELLEKMKG